MAARRQDGGGSGSLGARIRLWLAVVVLFCAPPAILVLLIVLHVVGVITTTAQSLVPLLFFGGISVMAAGWVPDVVAVLRRREPVGGTNTLFMWVALVIGLLVWASIPVVLVLGGTGPFGLFAEPVSTTAREFMFSPAWIAFLSWPLAAVGVYGLVRFVRRRGRGGRPDQAER